MARKGTTYIEREIEYHVFLSWVLFIAWLWTCSSDTAIGSTCRWHSSLEYIVCCTMEMIVMAFSRFYEMSFEHVFLVSSIGSNFRRFVDLKWRTDRWWVPLLRREQHSRISHFNYLTIMEQFWCFWRTINKCGMYADCIFHIVEFVFDLSPWRNRADRRSLNQRRLLNGQSTYIYRSKNRVRYEVEGNLCSI